jgi:hypothetical protein
MPACFFKVCKLKRQQSESATRHSWAQGYLPMGSSPLLHPLGQKQVANFRPHSSGSSGEMRFSLLLESVRKDWGLMATTLGFKRPGAMLVTWDHPNKVESQVTRRWDPPVCLSCLALPPLFSMAAVGDSFQAAGWQATCRNHPLGITHQGHVWLLLVQAAASCDCIVLPFFPAFLSVSLPSLCPLCSTSYYTVPMPTSALTPPEVSTALDKINLC